MVDSEVNNTDMNLEASLKQEIMEILKFQTLILSVHFIDNMLNGDIHPVLKTVVRINTVFHSTCKIC